MSSEKLLSIIKKCLWINGILDIGTGLPLLLFPQMFATMMGFADFTDSFRFLAGGWGIAAIIFGITRIWVAIKDEFLWPTVMLGALEGSLLGAFCLILVFATSLTLMNVVLAMLMGYGFMIIYVSALIYRTRK
ncbi:MAG: hypothetical protein ACTSRK_12740 [Promethearchaeota archaeon]